MSDSSAFGRYELLAKVGERARGAAYVVCAAGDPGDRLYLLELSTFPDGEDEALRRFRRDVGRAAQLQHPNVLRIVDSGAAAAGHYVVM
jgi:hypothetical protein